MIFNEIKMKNFRQFRNECVFEFSSDINKQITLIIAKNGVGKTTLLQAFRFCFYGESPNYLRLPKADELLNTNARIALKENQSETVSVEVKFTFNGIKYLAKREKNIEKKNGKIRNVGDTTFKLFRNDKLKGYKLIPDEIATETIAKMLPPGISHIFMFDGERMEKKITDSSYKNELSKSVTGLLGLDKLRYARDKIIGEKKQATSLISRIDELITTSKAGEEKILKEFKDLKLKLDENYKNVRSINNRISEFSDKIVELKKDQKIINDQKDLINERDSLEKEIKVFENEKKNLLKQSNDILFTTLYNKYLLLNRNKLNTFLSTAKKTENFYQSLHVDTLNDIKLNNKCICGCNVYQGTPEWEHINNLYQYALPNEYSSYINKIRNEINKGIDYSIGVDELIKVKERLLEIKSEIYKRQNKMSECIDKITEFEKMNNIEQIQNQIESKSKILGGYESKKNELLKEQTNLESSYKKTEKLVNEINSNEKYNERVREAVSDLSLVKNLIDDEYQKQESLVKELLSKYLKSYVKILLDESYETIIEDDYSIRIFNNDMKNEVTEKLSTGESVVVSLSFVNSLLQTAKEINSYNSSLELKYGVVMDAALSNVDELRIRNLCSNMFNSLDQLIFLSFKRQLRDELFNGISEKIGCAYIMSKKKSGDVMIEKVSLNELKEIIHTVEAGDEI